MRHGCLLLLVLGVSTTACNTPEIDLPEKLPADLSEISSEPMAGMGVMVGELTPHGALVQVRLTRADKLVQGDVPGIAGLVEFALFQGDSQVNLQTVRAVAERDFIARAAFADLKPATEYVCKTRFGVDADTLQVGPEARFRTLAGKEIARLAKFVVVTGMNYGKFHGDDRIDRRLHLRDNNTDLPRPYRGPDKQLGYPALKTILSLKPDFFVGTGDNVYYDTPKEPRAETIDQMRQKWHEQFVQPRYVDLFAEVPTYWEIDDHDYRIDDGDNTGSHSPSPEEGRRVMLEQLPVAAADDPDAKTYRTRRVSRDLQIWMSENRMYRSPNAMPDGPGKSIWGAEQKAWLRETLQASDATFKILISPTPMIGPDDLRKTDNHADVGGFQHERDEFFDWLTQTGIARNFCIVCGDRHWQYHSIYLGGLEEFSCGALVDANSRPGRRPGDRKSTDPVGWVEQPYSQETPSGGFLMVQVAPATDDKPSTLTFLFHDEKGEVLHEHVKQAKGP